MMFMPKLIKTEGDYEKALARIEEIFDSVPGTPEFDEMELLVKLVELYEEEKYPMDTPDPITAIRFRMEQQNLKSKDLIPFIGSKSKVSEVLSGKRALSLNMIRKLNAELGIPAEILISEGEKGIPNSAVMEHGINFPFTEMFRRGWFGSFFNGTLSEAKEIREELIVKFIGPFDIQNFNLCYNRKSRGAENEKQNDILLAWRIRVMNIAYKEQLPKWNKEILDEAFFRELAHLSYFEEGPKLAKEFLNKIGIHFVVEEHLKTTYLDGSSMLMPDGNPLVAMTLRYDRLDSFWFTLFHELAHIKLHLLKQNDAYFDDMSNDMEIKIEKEADEYAKQMLIADEIWKKELLTQYSTVGDVKFFADTYRINVAIPAGKIRYQNNNYTIFTNLLGNGKVRNLFV